MRGEEGRGGERRGEEGGGGLVHACIVEQEFLQDKIAIEVYNYL